MTGGLRRCVNAEATVSQSLVLSSVVALKKEPRNFFFDCVFGEKSTQEHVFDRVGRPITTACLEGYNGTIFAYGQTGSGKTYTMLGDNQNKGLVPRVLQYLFDRQDANDSSSSIEYTYMCSFLEIYNEKVYDLLDMSNSAGENGLQLRENHSRGVFVEGLQESVVHNAQEAANLMAIGTQNRHVGETSMNRESSRSHSVFVLHIHSTETTSDGLIKKRQARFNLVDLAGSERQKSTEAAGERLKEAGNINKSLSALGNVILALAESATGKSRHVHYRDSKLTYLLKDSLGGNSKTFMIAAISPAEDCLSETLSTLKFAQRAKMIKNNAFINEDTLGEDFTVLQEEIKRLRQQLALMSTQTTSSRPNFVSSLQQNPLPVDCDPTVDSRFRELETTLSHVVEEHITQKRSMEMLQLREQHVRELCAQMKRKIMHLRLLLKLKADKEKDNQILEIERELECNPSIDALEWRIKYEDMEKNFVDLQDTLAHVEEVEQIHMMHLEVAKQLAVVIKDKHTLQDRLNASPSALSEDFEAMKQSLVLPLEAKISEHQFMQNHAETELARLSVTLHRSQKVQNELQQKLILQQELLNTWDKQSQAMQDKLSEEIAKRENESVELSKQLSETRNQLVRLKIETHLQLVQAQTEHDHAMAREKERYATLEASFIQLKSQNDATVAGFDQTIKLANITIESLTEQVTALEISNKSKQETIQNLKQEHEVAISNVTEQFDSKLNHYLKSVEDLNGQIEELTLKKTSLEQNITELNTATSNMQQKYSLDIDELNQSLEAKDEELQIAINEAVQVTCDFNQASQEFKQKESDLQLALQNRMNQVSALEDKNMEIQSSFEERIAEVAQKLEQSTNHVDNLMFSNQALENTITQLKIEIDQTKNEREIAVTKLLETLESKEDKLQVAIGEIERVTYEWKEAIVAHENKESELLRIVSEEKSRVAQLESKVNELLSQIHSLEAANRNLEVVIEELKSQIATNLKIYEENIAQHFEKFSLKEDELRQAVTDLEKTTEDMNKRSEIHACNERELLDNLTKATSKAKSLEEANADVKMKYETHVKQSGNDIHELKKKNVSLEFKINDTSTRNLQLENSIVELKGAVDEIEDRLQEAIGEVERLTFEMKQAQDLHESIRADLERQIGEETAKSKGLEKAKSMVQTSFEEKIGTAAEKMQTAFHNLDAIVLKNQYLEHKIKQLDADRQRKDATILGQEQRLTFYDEKLKSAAKSLNETKEQLAEAMKKEIEMRGFLDREIAANSMAKETFDIELAAATERMNSLIAEKEALENEKTSLEETIQRNTLVVEELKASLLIKEKKLVESASEIERVTNDLSNAIEKYNSREAELLQEISQIQSEKQTTEAHHLKNVERLKEETKQRENNILELLEKANMSVKSLETKLADVETINLTLEKQIENAEDLAKQLKKVQDEKIIVDNLLQLQQNEKAAAKEDSIKRESALKEEIAELKQHNDVLCSTLQLDKAEFQARIEALEFSLKDKTAMYDDLQKEWSDAKTTLDTERKKVKEEHDTIRLKMIDAAYELDQTKRENERLNVDLESLQKKLKELMEEKEKLVGQGNVRQKIQHHIKIKEENNRLVQEVRQLTDEKFRLKNRVEKLEIMLGKENFQGSPPKKQKVESPTNKRTRA
ncbi:unnamed protein product [Aphanomyces euteiches]